MDSVRLDYLASPEFTPAAREWIESDSTEFDRSSLSTLIAVG